MIVFLHNKEYIIIIYYEANFTTYFGSTQFT